MCYVILTNNFIKKFDFLIFLNNKWKFYLLFLSHVASNVLEIGSSLAGSIYQIMYPYLVDLINQILIFF